MKLEQVLAVRKVDGMAAGVVDSPVERSPASVGGLLLDPQVSAGATFQTRALLDNLSKDGLAYAQQYLQILPVAVVGRRGQGGPEFLRYRRSKASGEKLLVGSSTLCWGGHVNLADAVCGADGSLNLVATVAGAWERELREELRFSDGQPLVARATVETMELIYTTGNDVSSVHLGLLSYVRLPSDRSDLVAADNTSADLEWLTVSQLKAELESSRGTPHAHELWSEIVINRILEEFTPEAPGVNAPSRAVVVYTTDTCGPCKSLKAQLDGLVLPNDVQVEIVNVHNNPPPPETGLVIQSVPTLVLYEGGRVLKTRVGAMSREEFIGWVIS